MTDFCKTYADAIPVAEVLRRSEAAKRAGVPTPAARPGRAYHEVAFDKLEGETRFALLSGDLSRLLRPLVALHRSGITGLGPFDPLLRIRPRLSLTRCELIHDFLAQPVPGGTAVLHGDLHVGQFIRDGAGKVWIIDLDDMALGRAEADLANFIAHLATSVEGSVAEWTTRVTSAWHDLEQSFDAAVLGLFIGFALVRRHLKLREAGQPDFEDVVMRYLRESPNFSIR